MQFKIKQENDEKVIRVVEVTESSITLDANHLLAGKDFFFEIKLVDIIQSGPGANLYFKLGTALEEKGLLEEAAEHYHDAIETDSDFTEAYFKLGVLYQIMGFNDEAIEHYQNVLRLKADHIEALINLGNLLRIKGQFDVAISYFNKAIVIKPDYASTHNNLGAAFKDKGELDTAILHYRKALELDNEFAEAHNNLGMALQEKAQFEDAEKSFRKAVQLNSNLPEAHVNLSSALLLSGKLIEGWEEYAWRLKTERFDSRYHNFQYPVWDGSSLLGKNLLICSEQGVGDEIMFASCLPDVIDQAASCRIECDRRLLPLFSRSFPKTIFFDREAKDIPDLSSVGLKTALGSLPKYFRSGPDKFPDNRFYLFPDSNLLDLWKERFHQLGHGKKIGIAWRGGQHAYIRGVRSIPLEQWSQLFSIPECSFISLQYGDVADEIDAIRVKMGMTIHNWKDANPLENLDDFAAEIAALDLVISVDNATVHLAGALGKPVWTLLPYVPDWRWMLNRENTPWYPAMRLFRQPTSGDWISVINHVAEELTHYA